MQTCEIKWIDEQGNPTPDSNPAIQRVRTIARVQQIAGRGVRFEASQWFCICAEHSKRLNDKGMDIWECAALERDTNFGAYDAPWCDVYADRNRATVERE